MDNNWNFTASSGKQLDLSEDLKNAANEFGDEYNSLYEQIGNLGNYWVGEDYTAFNDGTGNYRQALDDLKSSIELFSNHFAKMSSGTEELAAELAEIIENATTAGVPAEELPDGGTVPDGRVRVDNGDGSYTDTYLDENGNTVIAHYSYDNGDLLDRKVFAGDKLIELFDGKNTYKFAYDNDGKLSSIALYDSTGENYLYTIDDPVMLGMINEAIKNGTLVFDENTGSTTFKKDGAIYTLTLSEEGLVTKVSKDNGHITYTYTQNDDGDIVNLVYTSTAGNGISYTFKTDDNSVASFILKSMAGGAVFTYASGSNRWELNNVTDENNTKPKNYYINEDGELTEYVISNDEEEPGNGGGEEENTPGGDTNVPGEEEQTNAYEIVYTIRSGDYCKINYNGSSRDVTYLGSDSTGNNLYSYVTDEGYNRLLKQHADGTIEEIDSDPDRAWQHFDGVMYGGVTTNPVNAASRNLPSMDTIVSNSEYDNNCAQEYVDFGNIEGSNILGTNDIVQMRAGMSSTDYNKILNDHTPILEFNNEIDLPFFTQGSNLNKNKGTLYLVWDEVSQNYYPLEPDGNGGYYFERDMYGYSVEDMKKWKILE